MVILMSTQVFVNCATPNVVFAKAKNYLGDAPELNLHSEHHQCEYSYGGGFLGGSR
jgi:hypothetical protein